MNRHFSAIKLIHAILILMLLLPACKDKDPFVNQPETDTATPISSDAAIAK